MSLERIGLAKVLVLFQASDPQRRRMLREDIRSEIRRESGLGSGSGGDFYVPFWADAKRHVAGEADLRAATHARIASNDRRSRLYEMLANGFLTWWEERRRLRNEPFTIHEEPLRARYEALGLGTIKVENTLSITVVGDGRRVIYPYFCEDPELSQEAARIGLWLMSECFAEYAPEQMRILDVIAGRSFSVLDTPLMGDEEEQFLMRYADLLGQWRALRTEYA